MTDSRLNQTVKLANGRRLGFAEYGPPDGLPILYFHGHPGSRLELSLFANLESILTRQNLRIVAVERPGIGLSDFQPGRRFVDWPADVSEFADKVLKMERFNLLTYSAGGPYGVACAWKIPARLERVTLVSSPCPFNQPGALDGVGPAFYWRSARIHPLFTGMVLRMAGGTDSLPPPERAGMAKVDYELIAELEDFFPQFMRVTFGESCRGGRRGPAYEARMYVKDWGISFSEIHKKIELWHGDQDMNAPVHHLRWLEDQLPQKEVYLFQGEGHVTLIYRYMEDILRSAGG